MKEILKGNEKAVWPALFVFLLGCQISVVSLLDSCQISIQFVAKILLDFSGGCRKCFEK